MFKNRDAQYDVETAAGYRCQRVGQVSFDRGDLRLFFEIRSQCRIDQDGSFYLRQNRSDERCLIAAAEVANFFSAKRTRMLPDLISGQPDAKPVHESGRIILPVRSFPRPSRGGGFTSA